MNAHDIDPELPWGHWLMLDEEPYSDNGFVDPADGRRWKTLRSALWEGRLGMGRQDGELLETMHAVMAATVRRRSGSQELEADLFQYSRPYRRMFVSWLEGHGLIVRNHNGEGVEALTAEGCSVLHLLMATREHRLQGSRPSSATIRDLSELGLGPEEREDRLARVERLAARWNAAFLRRHEGGRASIVLVNKGNGLVPVFETVWTLRLANVEQRDAFYEWLCHRLDRWEAWAERGSAYGSSELTMHLLQVAAAALADGAEPVQGERVPPLA